MKLLCAVLIAGSLYAKAELPNAPEAMFTSVPAQTQVNDRRYTWTDWALAVGEFAARSMDFVSTMRCQGDVVQLSYEPRGTLFHVCHEVELPQGFVAGRAQFAFFSFGMAALQGFGQWELTRHGHRAMARRLAMVSVGATAVTVAHNYEVAR